MLNPDTNLKVRTLENGMKIAVYRNSEPPNRVSMRLLVRRGSAVETPEQSGIAHFTEHMAFNGTKRFPSGDMVEYFQRLGMAFGADTNAHTGFTETVYKIDMPSVEEKTVSDGLRLLRDYCDGILFEPAAIDAERGVILAEKDSRDTKDYRRSVSEINHDLKGTSFENRMPIGDAERIKKFTQADFKHFYAQNYRPENCVLVVVGDVDENEILKKSAEIFGSFKASEDLPNTSANYGSPEKPSKKFAFGAGKPEAATLYFRSPASPRSTAALCVTSALPHGLETLPERIRTIRLKALAEALAARLDRISEGESEISSGYAANDDFAGAFNLFCLGAEAEEGKCMSALAEIFRQVEGAKDLSESEMENAKKKILESLESAVKVKSTRKNQAMASAIASAFSRDEVFSSPEDNLEIARGALENFGTKEAVELFEESMNAGKIKIFLSDSFAEPSEDALGKDVQKAFSEAAKTPHSPALFATKPLEFSKFGAAGEIEHRTHLDDLDITSVVFKNGVRLNVKRTEFSRDSFVFKASFGNGIMDIPAENPEYYAAFDAILLGGTRFQTFADISAAINPLRLDLNSGIDGNAFALTGSGASKNMATLVKLCATFISDAGFRPDGLPALKKLAYSFYTELETDPVAQLRFASTKLAKGRISEIPGQYGDFAKADMPAIEAWLRPILENGYLEISVVGDIDVEDVIDAVSATFGALPAREAEKQFPYAEIEYPSDGAERTLYYKTTNEPISVAVKMWPSCGRDNAPFMRSANIAGAVLDDVLRKEVREKKGGAYSPFAYNNSSPWMKDTGFMVAATLVAPQLNAQTLNQLDDCAKLVEKDITPDQFERAKVPLLKSIEASRRKNAYWLSSVLDLCQARPQNLELARTFESGYNSATLEEAKEAAKKILSRPSISLRIMPLPQDASAGE